MDEFRKASEKSFCWCKALFSDSGTALAASLGASRLLLLVPTVFILHTFTSEQHILSIPAFLQHE